jgi:PHS family inorganic phosphate transporter-like MFS transporter
MQIFALFMLCGIFTSLLIPETKRKTLEELAGEVPGYVYLSLAITRQTKANANPFFSPQNAKL